MLASAMLLLVGLSMVPQAAASCSSITIVVEIEECGETNGDNNHTYTVEDTVTVGNMCNGEPGWNSYTNSCTQGVSVNGATVGVRDGPGSDLCVQTPVGCYGRAG